MNHFERLPANLKLLVYTFDSTYLDLLRNVVLPELRDTVHIKRFDKAINKLKDRSFANQATLSFIAVINAFIEGVLTVNEVVPEHLFAEGLLQMNTFNAGDLFDIPDILKHSLVVSSVIANLDDSSPKLLLKSTAETIMEWSNDVISIEYND